jgi:hypothetical protein
VEFISEQGFSVKQGKEEELQAWLAANEAALAASYPAGTSLIGIFVVTWSSEKTAGSWRSLERLDSYGAQDTLAAIMKDPSSEYSRLWRELSAFGDWDRDAHWSQTLLKRATDATVWNPIADD